MIEIYTTRYCPYCNHIYADSLAEAGPAGAASVEHNAGTTPINRGYFPGLSDPELPPPGSKQ